MHYFIKLCQQGNDFGDETTCIPADNAALTPLGLSSKTRQLDDSSGGDWNLKRDFKNML